MPSSSATPDYVRWRRSAPALRCPTLIAAFEGWNDAGDAATMAAKHLARQLKAEPVADIDPEPFYDFSVARPLLKLDGAGTRSLTWPSNRFLTARIAAADHDAVVLIGIEPQLRWRTFCEQVIATARALQAARVVTVGALLADVLHNRPAEVYGSTDDPAMADQFRLTPSSYEGPTGIVGVLTAACRDAGFPTLSFWSAVPSYMPGAPSPKAALALTQRIAEFMEAPVMTTDLEVAAVTYERQVSEIVAEDEETAEYVAGLEEAWEADPGRRLQRSHSPVGSAGLEDDPDRLVAEVEQFLRDNE